MPAKNAGPAFIPGQFNMKAKGVAEDVPGVELDASEIRWSSRYPEEEEKRKKSRKRVGGQGQKMILFVNRSILPGN